MLRVSSFKCSLKTTNRSTQPISGGILPTSIDITPKALMMSGALSWKSGTSLMLMMEPKSGTPLPSLTRLSFKSQMMCFTLSCSLDSEYSMNPARRQMTRAGDTLDGPPHSMNGLMQAVLEFKNINRKPNHLRNLRVCLACNQKKLSRTKSICYCTPKPQRDQFMESFVKNADQGYWSLC